MNIWTIFSDSEIFKIEEELKLLKEKKLQQEQEHARLVEYEKQFLLESDAVIIAMLHPVVKVMVRKTLVKAGQTGLKVGIYMGIRTFKRQAELYALGRKQVNGVWQVTNQKEVVTNALPGYSWHNHALAADIVMDGSPRPGLQPSWGAFKDANGDKVNDWTQLGEIGESFGLTWGGRWKKPVPVDAPHFQYHGDLTIEDALALYKFGGLDAVWERVV